MNPRSSMHARARARLTLALVFLLGCASTGNWQLLPTRPATDVPDRFEPIDRALRLTPGDTLAGRGCLSPLIDPRDGATIRFVRSADVGDYEAPSGRYGVGPEELLRIQCNTGRVLGVVGR